jgi:cytochrome c oxidase subunit 2
MMRGIVVVDTETDYQAWLHEQKTFAQLSAKQSLVLVQGHRARVTGF